MSRPQLYEHCDLRAISTRKVSFQCLTLESSFLYKFTKSASFYNAKPILTKPNALLAIKFPGSQCLGTGMTPS
ncbi:MULTISPECIES: hypothetical protein [unclassified Wolbachia]|uniref:hypothetical protein n=1 Tax=unclassified Wolbachia TaxID=2640676 RepID=UPI00223163BD|nr:hypothetical protein [Wolbachia endosymbiont (group A) of Apoderus coryli]